jgi:hypothetical protein
VKDGYFAQAIPTIKKVDPLVAAVPEGSDGDGALPGDGGLYSPPIP